jgi:RNA polymerase-binding transcription factor DksA
LSIQIEHFKESLQERKRELLEAKRQNTKVINDITELGDRENELKKKLDSTNKQLFVLVC